MEEYYLLTLKDKDLYLDIEHMNTESEIISDVIKTQTFNVIENELNDIIAQNASSDTKYRIEYLKTIMNDARIISIYKFQFKLLLDLIQKEIKTLKEYEYFHSLT